MKQIILIAVNLNNYQGKLIKQNDSISSGRSICQNFVFGYSFELIFKNNENILDIE
jgi:ABC-type iron transport system FetAB permease component